MSSDTEREAQSHSNPSLASRLLLVSVPLVVVAVAAWFWLSSGGSVSTDNAYLKMDRVSIASEVGGRIVEVAVRENQTVKQGQLLFRIDAESYRLKVLHARAALDVAEVALGTMTAEVQTSSVEIKAAQEDIAFAELNFERQAELMQRGLATKADFDSARHELNLARERLRQAQAEESEARSKLAAGTSSNSNPSIEVARIEHEQALLNLSRTAVYAPVDGRLAQANRLQVGQMMVEGLPALTIVEHESAWVEANFKETDLTHMRPGQPAEIQIDAYPDISLKGHVDSIGSGTGAEFSVLPAQNATGNWVKVTQRVPVKILLDEKPDALMVAGLSAKVKVITDSE